MANDLHQAVLLADGEDGDLPLFIHVAFRNLPDSDIKIFIDMLRKTGRQIFISGEENNKFIEKHCDKTWNYISSGKFSVPSECGLRNFDHNKVQNVAELSKVIALGDSTKDASAEKLVYQEDCINLICEITGYSHDDSDYVRRMIAKGGLSQIAEHKFIKAGCERGLKEDYVVDILSEIKLKAERLKGKTEALFKACLLYKLAYIEVYCPTEYKRALAEYYMNILKEKMKSEIVVLDIETTGLAPATHIGEEENYILEISAVKLKEGAITEKFHTYVDNGIEIPEKISLLTGIDNSLIDGAPDVITALKEFQGFCGALELCAVNGGFSERFFKYFGKGEGLYLYSKGVTDLLPFIKSISPDIGRYDMKTLKKRFEIEDDKPYVESVVEIMNRLIQP